jgi:hypothetical protein
MYAQLSVRSPFGVFQESLPDLGVDAFGELGNCDCRGKRQVQRFREADVALEHGEQHGLKLAHRPFEAWW